MSHANYLVIPDIHGQISQYNQIEAFIKELINDNPNIHIIFLGDYIDRGENGYLEVYDKNKDDYLEKYFLDIGSRLIVEKLFELEKYFIEQKINYTFLMGNHEDIFISNIKNIESFSARKNTNFSKDYMAMYQAIIGFNQDFNLLNKTMHWFEQLPLYYQDTKNKLFFVHGGVHPHKELLENSKNDYLNLREKFFNVSKQFPNKIIFGHTPIDSIIDTKYVDDNLKILLRKDRIGLDSGNYRNHYMNLLRINDDNYTLIKIDSKGIRSKYLLTF